MSAAWRRYPSKAFGARLAVIAALLAGGLAIGLQASPLFSPAPPRALMPTLDFALGAASELPSKRLVEEIAGSAPAAATALLQIALDPNRTPGVRLRALAILPGYPSPALQGAMRNLLDGYAAGPALTPIDVWMVRGALEALATCGDAQDVARMTIWLEWEPSRDIRARAAWALGALGELGGVDALKKRFLRESVGQVSYQITAALDLLEQ